MESDEELMEAVARGDERALGLLVDRHGARIHAHLARMTGSGDDADDLLQETWVRVARSARTYTSGRPVRPWLYGIASNLARDLGRRRAVRARGDALATADREPGAAPQARVVEGRALRERVARLPERLREVVLLRYFEDLDEAEMAEALGVPRGTVKSRLHGAIQALKRGWEEER
jgi:RNA polymerase sigma factor (sigma-70 family)